MVIYRLDFDRSKDNDIILMECFEKIGSFLLSEGFSKDKINNDFEERYSINKVGDKNWMRVMFLNNKKELVLIETFNEEVFESNEFVRAIVSNLAKITGGEVDTVHWMKEQRDRFVNRKRKE